MFPLGTVLMPGVVLPLHVFEPRYQSLVQDCIEGSQEFGVVLIARGNEVGGGDERTIVGTLARMVQVARLDGGRYAVMAIGTSRIRVQEWLDDAPYPRALVEEWPDDSDLSAPNTWWDGQGEASALLGALVSRTRRLAALALELGDRGGDPGQALADAPVRLSYEVSDLAPLGPTDRFALLSAPGPVARMDLLSGLLDDVESVLRFRLDDGSSSDPPTAW
jgi:Lon protease-like protein